MKQVEHHAFRPAWADPGLPQGNPDQSGWPGWSAGRYRPSADRFKGRPATGQGHCRGTTDRTNPAKGRKYTSPCPSGCRPRAIRQLGDRARNTAQRHGGRSGTGPDDCPDRSGHPGTPGVPTGRLWPRKRQPAGHTTAWRTRPSPAGGRTRESGKATSLQFCGLHSPGL